MLGWWQCVKAADINADGKEDLIFGNIGDNFYLRPTATSPVKLWLGDFDNNGLPDKVFSKTAAGKDVPVFLKKEFTEILPSYKKENLLHHEFAKKTIQTIFKEKAASATVKTFNYTYSCVAVNKGNRDFDIRELPAETQLSSINAILVSDIDGNGTKDIMLGGNSTEFLPQFGRLDANFGTLLHNDGKGNFSVIPSAKTGIQVSGMVKDIALLQAKDKKLVLFLRNNDKPQLFSVK